MEGYTTDKVLTLPNIKLVNRLLSKVELPQTPEDIIREIRYIKTEYEENIPLSIYRLKDMDDNIPCLIYFHGGGSFLYCLSVNPLYYFYYKITLMLHLIA